ncbi:hypothetical protein SAMN00120144_2771 [Hymenobacter roseosalivarius DSM 11622]|uniref:Uncharacterized protein n=1 Tax=Hymenobacter roseosalivarius DSM 11622 TaxID=645990 RepID=A0A1W1W326_9BACT|nr:hypothetical protein SAMN00120144_2771 [Hymenobacter roseosalivarius DSM 11622]
MSNARKNAPQSAFEYGLLIENVMQSGSEASRSR